MRARPRTSKLLLRQGILWSGGTAWTGAHEQWLGQQRFELPGLQAAYDTTLETVLLATSRRARLDQAIIEMAYEPQWWPTVSRLQRLRGVSTLTAFGLAVEVGDWSRFSGSTIGAYLGLVPTESSSGEGRNQGSITKTGNTHALRLLPACPRARAAAGARSHRSRRHEAARRRFAEHPTLGMSGRPVHKRRPCVTVGGRTHPRLWSAWVLVSAETWCRRFGRRRGQQRSRPSSVRTGGVRALFG